MQNFTLFTMSLEAEFFFQQGLRRNKAKKYKTAIASLDKALKCKPDYADAWSQRGFALGSLGRHEEAVASFDAALAIRLNACWWHNRGIALGKLGCYFEAINSFERAIEFHPASSTIWHDLISFPHQNQS